MRRLAAAVALAGAVAGCGRPAASTVEKAILNYNRTVVEAYRTADPALVESVAGPEEAKKITGLIGVRLDMGRVLDAELVELELEGFRREEDGSVTAVTHERWRYRERELGSGRPTGPESEDEYRVAYRLERRGGEWIVARTWFREPPRVGRRLPGWEGGGRAPHGSGR